MTMKPYSSTANAVRTRRHYKKHKEQIAIQKRTWRRRNPEQYKARYTKRNIEKYGITVEQYHEMLKDQNSQCAICQKHSLDLNQRLCIDHDHRTGRIRGLLCRQCNLVIGNASEKIETLLQAIDYLRRNLK